MSRRTTLTVAAGLVTLGLLTPAVAEEVDGEPYVAVLTTQETWFDCDATGKAHNVAKQATGAITWSTTRPTASEASGAGCSSVDWTYDPTFGYGPYAGGPVRDVASTVTYSGTYTGNLDSLTFRQWAMSFGDPAGTWPVELGVKVDGKDVVAFPRKVRGTKVADGLKDISTITVTGIGLLSEEENREHAVEVTFRYDEPFRATVWQWGTAESASGIVFNPSTSRGAVVSARR